jgi:hypothetical protein
MCVATSCGSGSGTGTATFSTSLPAAATVDGLSSSQSNQLCSAVTSFLEMLLKSPGYCRVTGVAVAASDAAMYPDWTDAQIQDDCNMWSQFCQAILTDGTATSTCNPNPCPVTVGELTACLDDTGAAFNRIASSAPTCGSLTRATIPSFGGQATPASCAPITAQCPGINTGSSTN